MTNSRRKGAREELATAKAINVLFPTAGARRGQQFSGSPESPDIKHDIVGVHIENKAARAVPKWNYAALAQAQDDCLPSEVPIVIAKRDRQPRLVILELSDLPCLVRALAKHVKETT